MAEQDFLTEIRETEKQAALLIARARDDARLKLEQAREQAARVVSQSRDETAVMMQKKLQNAEETASAVRSELETATGQDIASGRAAFENLLHQVAGVLAERIVKADAHR